MLPKINIEVGLTPFDIAEKFLNSAPVDLIGMADALGIEVDMNARFKNPQTSGSIKKCRDGLYRIEVNAADSDHRKRFTLAHEISHFLLHKDIIDRKGLVDDAMYRSGASKQEEYQANRMAADLLMPKGMIRTLWNNGIRSLSQLGTAFGASEDAVRIRLKQLGYGA